MSDFQGDLLLFSTNDGGEIEFTENNCFQNDTGFETAIYLSLFGGNYNDNGTEATKNESWWGNNLENNNPERKLVSRFQNISRGLPLTPGNLLILKDAIKEDLQWFIDEKIIDILEINLSIPSKNRLLSEINGIKDKSKLFGVKYFKNFLSKIP